MDWIENIAGGRTISLEPGETVFRQRDAVYAVFRVKSGRVRLTRMLENGAILALHTARAGETFAEAAVSADVYHCDAVAEVRSQAEVIPVQPLRDRLAGDAGAALSFAFFMAGQVRTLRTRLELRNIRSARDRLLTWLQLNATGSPPGVRLDQPWTEVAAEIGLTREALYRALADLGRAGTIQRDAGRSVLIARQADGHRGR